MADPTLCAFLTKVLCAHGGSMLLQDLRAHVELAEARLRAVLREAGPARFLLRDAEEPESLALAGGAGAPDGDDAACRVVAVSTARLCARYQRAECRACDQLHLCRRHMLGKCPHRDCWSTCTLSHDIHTPGNIQVLKTHGLFGLNEAQLRILLLQNDPSLLPEVCLLYNRGTRSMATAPSRTNATNSTSASPSSGGVQASHLQTVPPAHPGHGLKVIEDQGLSLPSVINFQIIAAARHRTLHSMLARPASSASAVESAKGPGKRGVRGAMASRPSLPLRPRSQAQEKPRGRR